jgi:hypothetical protein
MKIKIEIIVIVAIVIGLFYMAVTSSEHKHKLQEGVSQCDPMEYSRLKVVLDECASGTMHDTWGK